MNQKYMTVMTSGAVATTLLFAQIAPASAQNTRTITLDAGTVIPVRLRDTLSSVDSRKGDHFMATVRSEDARSFDLPRGTNIEGTVTGVRPQEGKNPGVITLSFNRIMLPNESTYPIQGSLIGLDNKSVSHDSNGRLVAKNDQKNKTWTYTGYGAGAGLLLGAITKGNTIFDTLLGGGLGYLLGTQDKSHGDPRDVTLKPNTEMGVRLDRSIKIRTYTDNRDVGDNGYSVSEDSLRTRTDQTDDRFPVNRDRNRDISRDRDTYDEQSLDHRSNRDNDTYRILRQYTDLRDNGRPIRVIVDGTRVSFQSESRPFISNGVLMVPAVPVLKAADAHYTYTSGQFKADGPGEALSVNIDSRIAYGSNTHRFTLPASVQRRNGTTYVPMQFLAIVTGQKLTFDRDRQVMELGSDQPDNYDH